MCKDILCLEIAVASYVLEYKEQWIGRLVRRPTGHDLD